MATKSKATWDLLVYDRTGQPVLVVEVKRKTNAPIEWVTKLRRNLLAHDNSSNSPYFLIAFPDKFYLWVETGQEQNVEVPAYAIDAAPILQPYLERTDMTVESISRDSLELIVMSWLGALVYFDQPPENLKTTQKWLFESGLYAALSGGRLEYEAAA